MRKMSVVALHLLAHRLVERFAIRRRSASSSRLLLRSVNSREVLDRQLGDSLGELHRVLDLGLDVVLERDDLVLVDARTARAALARQRRAGRASSTPRPRPWCGRGPGRTSSGRGSGRSRPRPASASLRCARARDRLGDALAHAHDVVAVEAIARHAVAERAFATRPAPRASGRAACPSSTGCSRR